jgi:hypothetical protein
VAVPGFDTVTVCVALLPTLTFPKASLVGLNDSWAADGVTPVPERERVVGEPDTLLVIDMLPEALPVAVGANFTLKVVELPAFTLTGTVIPLMVKADPLRLACEIVRVALPGLEIVTVCVLLLPVLTLPKATVVGFSVICGPSLELLDSLAGVPIPSKAHPETKLVSTKVAASASQRRPIPLLWSCPGMSPIPSHIPHTPLGGYLVASPPLRLGGRQVCETLVRGPKLGQERNTCTDVPVSFTGLFAGVSVCRDLLGIRQSRAGYPGVGLMPNSRPMA